VYRIFRQVSGNKSDFNSFLYYFGSPLAINIEFVLVKVWIPIAYVPNSATVKS
jgi:hypothetical protein